MLHHESHLVLELHLNGQYKCRPYRCERVEKTCSYSIQSIVPWPLYCPIDASYELNDLVDATPTRGRENKHVVNNCNGFKWTETDRNLFNNGQLISYCASTVTGICYVNQRLK